MPIDPKAQPLAALAKQWRTEARNFRDTARNAAARNKNETWEECDTKARLLVKHAEELESALEAQCKLWEQAPEPQRNGDGTIDLSGAMAIVNALARSMCARDLRGDK